MTRPRTAADLILSLFLATGLAVWCGLGLLVVLGYQNGSSASTWTGRAMMLTMRPRERHSGGLSPGLFRFWA